MNCEINVSYIEIFDSEFVMLNIAARISLTLSEIRCEYLSILTNLIPEQIQKLCRSKHPDTTKMLSVFLCPCY